MQTEFSRWLQRQLDRREWDQARLVKETGASSGAVSMWVRGERRPSTRSIRTIAEVFDVSEDSLLEIADHRSKSRDIENDPLREDLHALIDGHLWPITDDLIFAIQSNLILHARAAESRSEVARNGQTPDRQ